MTRRHDFRHLVHHNGKVRLHLHTGNWLWTGADDYDGYSYKRYSVAHNLTRWQALKLGLRLIGKAMSR
jgi:hypothetical protein